jgi:FMN phosphatase YigB (HAD superfamily)
MSAIDHSGKPLPPTPVLSAATVTTWIFDLDNTLYPGESRLWPQIDLRITLFLSHFFGLDGLSARALQKHYYYRYGTTLNGLMAEHGIDPHPYLDFAHDIDLETLAPDPALGHAIATQGETIEELRAMVRDAVQCHFGDGVPGEMPRIVRLHFVRDEMFAL